MLQQNSQNIIFYLKGAVRKINNLFIFLVLIVFYFFVVGITALLFSITAIKRKKKSKSYWKNESNKENSLHYFKSPY